MNSKSLYSSIVAAALCLFCLHSLSAVQKAETEPNSKELVFNKKIGTLIKGETTDFEKKSPGLGMSVGYNAPGITLTVYKYNMGLKKIAPDPSSEMLTKHFRAIQQNIYSLEKQGKYKSVKEIMTETADIGNKKKAHHTIFEYIQTGKKRMSHMYLWANNNFFIKVRYTYDVERIDEAERNLELILRDLSK